MKSPPGQEHIEVETSRINLHNQFDQSSKNLDGLQFQEFFSAKIGFPPAFRSVFFFFWERGCPRKFQLDVEMDWVESDTDGLLMVWRTRGKAFVVSWTPLFPLTRCPL